MAAMSGPKRAPTEYLRRDVLDHLGTIWPRSATCTQLAAALGTRTVWLWPLLHELREAGRLESQEVAWPEKQIVYEVWRLDVSPADLAPEAGRKARHNPFIPAEREPAVTIPDQMEAP
jgi:hypothetical protein